MTTTTRSAACEDPALGANPDPPAATHALNPPSWILGTWTNCVDVGSSLNLSWTFTDNNAVSTGQSITVDYAELSESADVTDASGATWYRLEATADGTTTVYRFRARGAPPAADQHHQRGESRDGAVVPMTLQKLAAIAAAAVAVALLAACEDPAPGAREPDPDPPAASVLNPPAWILGTWNLCSQRHGPVSVEISWTFTEDAAVSTTNGLSVTYASGEDSESSDWYLLEVTEADGSSRGYRFHRVMDSTDRLLQNSYINGANLGTVNLCRV